MDWITANIDTINMDANLRSRRDVHLVQAMSLSNVSNWYANEQSELILLNSSQCVLQSCSLLFNTSDATLTGAINATGVIQSTSNGTQVALFAFDSIYIGPEVEVVLVGQRALVLSSRTSIVINTTFQVTPGTLGGFPGGASVARIVNESLVDNPRLVMICDLTNSCDNSRPNTNFSDAERASFISNNVNGPGSGNLRFYPFVITTSAGVIPEVQFIRTKVRNGQTLAGGFVLSFGPYSTPVIAHDVSALELEDIIESNLNAFNPRDGEVLINRPHGVRAGVGRVNVIRSLPDDNGAYQWNISFITAIGNVEQLSVLSYLEGLEAEVVTGTIQEGNEIGGYFTITFNNQTSTLLPSTSTADELKRRLLEIPAVAAAFVERTDPSGNCDDGLCPNGPFLSRGYQWTVYVAVDEEFGNITPYSPTSSLASTNGSIANVSVEFSGLTGTNASATLLLGLQTSSDQMKALLALSIPFSLCFGGAGGSFGGTGGQGYSEISVGSTYGDLKLADLFGGSGGCMRAKDPFEPNAYLGIVPGKGGAGGGAMELIAINDIKIGSFGMLDMRGGPAEQTSEGGGMKKLYRAVCLHEYNVTGLRWWGIGRGCVAHCRRSHRE
jgi:hypothetical protein